jgi:hypothetical protein
VAYNPTTGRESDEVMCETCTQLDDKIAHYVRLATAVTDQLTLEAIEKLVAELRDEKAALHP